MDCSDEKVEPCSTSGVGQVRGKNHCRLCRWELQLHHRGFRWKWMGDAAFSIGMLTPTFSAETINMSSAVWNFQLSSIRERWERERSYAVCNLHTFFDLNWLIKSSLLRLEYVLIHIVRYFIKFHSAYIAVVEFEGWKKQEQSVTYYLVFSALFKSRPDWEIPDI